MFTTFTNLMPSSTQGPNQRRKSFWLRICIPIHEKVSFVICRILCNEFKSLQMTSELKQLQRKRKASSTDYCRKYVSGASFFCYSFAQAGRSSGRGHLWRTLSLITGSFAWYQLQSQGLPRPAVRGQRLPRPWPLTSPRKRVKDNVLNLRC